MTNTSPTPPHVAPLSPGHHCPTPPTPSPVNYLIVVLLCCHRCCLCLLCHCPCLLLCLSTIVCSSSFVPQALPLINVITVVVRCLLLPPSSSSLSRELFDCCVLIVGVVVVVAIIVVVVCCPLLCCLPFYHLSSSRSLPPLSLQADC
jgi:hypothetical protein